MLLTSVYDILEIYRNASLYFKDLLYLYFKDLLYFIRYYCTSAYFNPLTIEAHSPVPGSLLTPTDIPLITYLGLPERLTHTVLTQSDGRSRPRCSPILYQQDSDIHPTRIETYRNK